MSVCTDALLTAGGHFGSVSLAAMSGVIFVYVPSTLRTSSGWESAYASDSVIAAWNRLTRSGFLAICCCDVK